MIIPDTSENADLSTRPQGYHGGTSRMFLVGEVSPTKRSGSVLWLLKKLAFYEGMRQFARRSTWPNQLPLSGSTSKQTTRTTHVRSSLLLKITTWSRYRSSSPNPQVVHYKNNDRTSTESGHVFHYQPMIQRRQVWLPSWKNDQDSWTSVQRTGETRLNGAHCMIVTDTGCEVTTLHVAMIQFHVSWKRLVHWAKRIKPLKYLLPHCRDIF